MCNKTAKRVFQRLKMALAFLLKPEPSINLNDSEITFTKMGDLRVKSQRHLIQLAGGLTFVGTPEEKVLATIEAHALGNEVFNRFLTYERVKETYALALERLKTLPPNIQPAAAANLKRLNMELVLLNSSVRTLGDDPESLLAFNAKASELQVVLERFLRAPHELVKNLSPEDRMRMQLENLTGASVEKVDFQPAESQPKSNPTKLSQAQLDAINQYLVTRKTQSAKAQPPLEVVLPPDETTTPMELGDALLETTETVDQITAMTADTLEQDIECSTDECPDVINAVTTLSNSIQEAYPISQDYMSSNPGLGDK